MPSIDHASATLINAITLTEQSTVPPAVLPAAGKHKLLIDDSSPVALLIVDSAGTVREIPVGDSGVTPGSYTSANITVDALGRITVAANGTAGGAGSDTTAIHDNVADEIHVITEKATPVGADVLVIEDSEASWAKKRVQIDNLPSSGGSAPSPEIFLTAAGGWPSTTGGCAANAKNEYGTNDLDLYSLDFDQSTEEYAQWSVWMPDDWDAGTITAKFVWSAASGTGDVIWALQGRSFANDDAIDQSWGTAQTVTDTLLATGDIHYTSATSAITLAGGPAAGELVQFRVYRDADAGGDTLNADSRLLGVKLYFTRA